MRRALGGLRREDDGFSLIELLSAMAIGSIVLTACMGVFMNGVKATTAIQNRVDNTSRARYSMDRIVRLLDSQVCTQVVATSDVQTSPVFSGSTDSSVTFYGDLDGATGMPEKYTITYVPKAGATPSKITIDDYAYNTTAKAWTTKVGATNSLVTDIVPLKVGGVAQPIFTYYPYIATSGTVTDIGNISATPASTPLTTDVAPMIVKVGVRFAAVSSTSHTDDSSHAYVSGSGSLATFNADPSAPTACP
jgi:prepilin-type N-terminal cleavage/methylation domain-containing protein